MAPEQKHKQKQKNVSGKSGGRSSFRRLMRGLLFLLAAVLLLGAILSAFAIWSGPDSGNKPLLSILLVAVLAGGLGLLRYIDQVLRLHLAALERLRGPLLAIDRRGSEGSAIAPYQPFEDMEVEGLRSAIFHLADRIGQRENTPDARLRSLLEASGEGLIMITQDGLVSLVNGVAKDLLGAQRIAVGTSIFAALERSSLDAALDDAHLSAGVVVARVMDVEGRTLEVHVRDFGGDGGAVLVFPVEDRRAPERNIAGKQRRIEGSLDLDLSLHEAIGPLGPLSDDLPLNHLPVVVFDTETTGLNVNKDRMISLGAVKLRGPRLIHAETLDLLVDPGIPIPAQSQAVHGISDAMVAGQAPFEMVEAHWRHFAEGHLLMGYNVPFDLAILRREYTLAQLPPPTVQSLDLFQLVAGLDPDMEAYSLDRLADYWGVEIRGRHTALGDALVTAELYRLLLPRLESEGIETLGQLIALCQRAKGVLRRQKEAGW